MKLFKKIGDKVALVLALTNPIVLAIGLVLWMWQTGYFPQKKKEA